MLATGLVLGGLLAPSALAAVQDLPELAWDWEPGRRYFLESSVVGVNMFLSADLNRDVLIRSFTIQLLIDCGSPERYGKRTYELRCDVEAFAIQAQPRPSDAGLVQLVLDEMEAKLEDDVWLQVRMHDNGQLLNFQMENYKARFRDQNRMAETVRLIVLRAFSGLEMRFPTRKLDLAEGVWGQTESVITEYPSAVGTVGSVEMVNLAAKQADDWLVVETAARAAISPAGSNDTYDTRVEARAVFDIADGYMVERVWVSEGWATAGSASSEAGTRPYVQAGRLFVVDEGVAWPELMETSELAPRPTTLNDRGATGGIPPEGF